MSNGFNDECKRESTLREEIEDLKKYNVPQDVIYRMCVKLAKIEEWNKHREESRLREQHFTEERLRNSSVVVDALGEYIYNKQREKRF